MHLVEFVAARRRAASQLHEFCSLLFCDRPRGTEVQIYGVRVIVDGNMPNALEAKVVKCGTMATYRLWDVPGVENIV